MEKRRTSVIAIVFYILGILFLAAAAFMLVSALGYTKTYLESYGATFGDMWSNTLQYIIAQFAPYLGIGVICLGLGRVIREAGGAKADSAKADSAIPAGNVSAAAGDGSSELAAVLDQLKSQIKYLSEDIDTTREVIGIKIEEKEKRDSYRLSEMGRELTEAMKMLEPDEEPVKISLPVAAAAGEAVTATEPAAADEAVTASEPAAAADEAVTASEPAAAPKRRPQIFTVSRRMTMPACEAVISAAENSQLSEINENDRIAAAETKNDKEEKTMKKYPQIFTMARKMVMPPCKK